ncbi:MAG: hypothetical protein METHP_01252 [Methanoregula sp. SKADARSKE-2]|nr:MAG: hypothetical protein METHP_01252 [Methanoregula sp. SKADARSKE-2]
MDKKNLCTLAGIAAWYVIGLTIAVMLFNALF